MPSTTAKPVVLVLDDEQDHCDLLAYLLRRSYEVHTATSAEQACEISANVALDVALVDYRIPKTTGVEFLSRLQQDQPECLRFLVTAYADPSIYQEAINKGGVYRFLPKPIDPDILKVDIIRALEHRTARQRLVQNERLALVGQLVSSVVHDINNCLQLTGMLPELLAMAKGPDDIHDCRQILSEVDIRMNDLVSELLALAKGGIPTYQLSEQSLTELVERTVKVERNGSLLKKVNIDLQLRRWTPRPLHWPVSAVRMLGNSAKRRPGHRRRRQHHSHSPTQ
ncbi:MAG: response regulator [Myxococcota bacterium]